MNSQRPAEFPGGRRPADYRGGVTLAHAPAIAAEALTVRRGGHTALDHVTVRVARGAITGLLGPSGCGKSTFMRSVVGTQLGVEGTVTVLGEPAGTPGLRARVGYMTQAASVYTDLTVRQNVGYFARLAGAGARAEVDAALAAVDLDRLAHRRARNLSGGQVRRVSLACALVGRPELLILDEPTVGLDPVLRADLWAQFRALADAGTTLLVSSHVMDEADHCDRLILMREGELVATTTAAEMRADTGCLGLDAAFLALINRDGATP